MSDPNDNRILDAAMWLGVLAPVLVSNADEIAGILRTLRRALDRGQEGVSQAALALDDSIKLAFEFSPAYKLAFDLFILQLDGRLRVEDEPAQILAEAIKRARPEPNSDRQTERIEAAGRARKPSKSAKGSPTRKRR